MKTRHFILSVVLLFCMSLLPVQAYAEEYIDFGDASVFEQALNDGEDVTNKIVSFEVMEIHPNSAFGFNIWSGQHLNFVSPSRIEASPRDKLTVRIKEVSSAMGSWIITYEVVDDAVAGPDTRYYDVAANQTKPLEIVECGFYCSNPSSSYATPSTYYSVILYNPNENKTIRFPTVRMTARDANGALLATNDQVLHRIDPYETTAFASFFTNLHEIPTTIDFQIVDPDEHNIIKPKNVAADPMRAVNYSMTKSEWDTKVVGEISNYTGYDYPMVGVVVLFRDANGNLAGGETNYVSNVQSGKTTPFDVSIHSALTVFDRYEVRIIPWSDAEISKASTTQSTQATAAQPATATAVATPAVASTSAAAVPSVPPSSQDSRANSNTDTQVPIQNENHFGQGTFIVGEDLRAGTYDITCVSANMDSYNESMDSFADLYSDYGLGEYSDYFGALGDLADSMNYVMVETYDKNGYPENILNLKPGETARIILRDGMKLEITDGSITLAFIR